MTSRAVELVGSRSRGGARRGVPGEGTRNPGRRVAGGPTGLTVDAYDAALLIGRHSAIWQPLDLLAHREIVQMAFLEARDALTKRRETLTGWRRMTAAGRVERRQIAADHAALVAAARVLVEAHDAGIFADG